MKRYQEKGHAGTWRYWAARIQGEVRRVRRGQAPASRSQARLPR